MHIQTHARVFTQAHVHTDTDRHAKHKIKERHQHNGVVMPSTAGWIYWLLCGMQIHPSCKNVLSGLLSSSSALALRWSLSTSNAFLSSHYNQSAGSDLEPGWLAQLTPECWLRARSSVQSNASLWGESRGRQGAI